MHWSEHESPEGNNFIRGSAGVVALTLILIGTTLHEGMGITRWSIAACLITSAFGYLILASTIKLDTNVWDEILLRPGQLWARIPLALMLACGLLIVGTCKATWWTSLYLVGHLYARTREYKDETLAALRVWLRLMWLDASEENQTSAEKLFWHWAKKRDDPRTRAQKREERRQRLLSHAYIDLDELQQMKGAHDKVETDDARRAALLKTPSRN